MRRVSRQFSGLKAGSVKAAWSCPARQWVPRKDHTGQAASRWAVDDHTLDKGIDYE